MSSAGFDPNALFPVIRLNGALAATLYASGTP